MTYPFCYVLYVICVIFCFREKVHNIPFAPIVKTHKKDKDLEMKEREKALDVFKKLALMWKKDVESKGKGGSKEKMPFFGQDEKKIQPKSVIEEFKFGKPTKLKKEPKEKMPLFGEDEKKIQPKFVSEEFEFSKSEKEEETPEPVLPFKFEDEDMLMKKQALEKEAFQKAQKEIASDAKKISEEEHAKKVLKKLRKEAEDLEKKAGKALPMFNEEKEKLSKLVKSVEEKPLNPEEFVKDAKESAEDWGKNPDSILSTEFVTGEDKAAKKSEEKMKIKESKPFFWENEEEALKGQTVVPEMEEESMVTKKKFENEHPLPVKSVELKEAEDRIIREQKFFDEAEKAWEEQLKKKAEENAPVKTTEQQEIDEELKEPEDATVTPSFEGDWPTVVPELKEEEPKNPEPVFPFQFDEEESSVEQKPTKEEKEEIHKLPLTIYEPPAIFQKPNQETGFEKMSEAVKPLFQDIVDQKKFGEEEKEWRRYKNIMKKIYEPMRNKAYWKKKAEVFNKQHHLFAPEGNVEE